MKETVNEVVPTERRAGTSGNHPQLQELHEEGLPAGWYKEWGVPPPEGEGSARGSGRSCAVGTPEYLSGDQGEVAGVLDSLDRVQETVEALTAALDRLNRFLDQGRS